MSLPVRLSLCFVHIVKDFAYHYTRTKRDIVDHVKLSFWRHKFELSTKEEEFRIIYGVLESHRSIILQKSIPRGLQEELRGQWIVWSHHPKDRGFDKARLQALHSLMLGRRF